MIAEDRILKAVAELEKLHKEEFESENDHIEADDILLGLIDDSRVSSAYEAVPKWYC